MVITNVEVRTRDVSAWKYHKYHSFKLNAHPFEEYCVPKSGDV